jgi:uncharacterized RDD family membrane protein YckC
MGDYGWEVAMSSTSSFQAREMRMELPEEVDLQLEVANVGSRSLAILADLALCGLVFFIVYGLTVLLSRNAATDWLSQLGANAVEIGLAVVIFGFQWVYFSLFEWLWNGQTPGKRLLHLRVIKADGAPVGWIDVLLRNVSRPIDTFGPMGLIGLLMIFVSRKGQRLGDVMARTLVIHETPIDWSIFDQFEPATEPGAGAVALPSIRLSAAQWELLHQYLNRRESLPAEVRARLAASLYEKLKPLARGTELELSTLAPEAWLAELARRT